MIQNHDAKNFYFCALVTNHRFAGGFTNPHQTSQPAQSKKIHKEINSSLRR